MITFTSIINKLTKGENGKSQCPFCWGAIEEKNDHNFCEECGIRMGDWDELI